jgi:histidinol phosphatase-like enzyme (inositol monophosphatase family)
MEEERRFAERLADAARAETLPRFAAGCAADDKGGANGFDPVTEADRGAERVMRALIEAEHPDHGISGEEFGDRLGTGPFSWSLDPVDGTRAFVCGMPTWVTLIALLRDGLPVLGVIDVPRLDERYVGYGEQCWLGDRRLKVSGCRTLAEARLSTTDPFLFQDAEEEAFTRIRKATRTARYGQDGYAYARLAAGTIDLVVESGLKPHDYNALIPIVRGAGGVIGNWKGGSDFSAGCVVAAASLELFDATIELLNF